MIDETKQNRRTRRMIARGIMPPQGLGASFTPIERARCLRHKKPWQQRQEAKRRLLAGV